MNETELSQQIRDKYLAFFEKYPPEEWSSYRYSADNDVYYHPAAKENISTYKIGGYYKSIKIGDFNPWGKMSSEHQDEVWNFFHEKRESAAIKNFLETEF